MQKTALCAPSQDGHQALWPQVLENPFAALGTAFMHLGLVVGPDPEGKDGIKSCFLAASSAGICFHSKLFPVSPYYRTETASSSKGWVWGEGGQDKNRGSPVNSCCPSTTQPCCPPQKKKNSYYPCVLATQEFLTLIFGCVSKGNTQFQ